MIIARRLLLILIGVAPASIIHAAETRTLKDVVYGHASGQALKLDAYLYQGAKPSPVLVFIHGGGWHFGDKDPAYQFPGQPPVRDVESTLLGFTMSAMREAGISVVSINYRLTDVAVYPAQVDDVTRAVQFVRYKAKEWRLNSQQLAVMGPSAGAHLALWIGLHPDRAHPKSSDAVERESTRVRAIVNYFGPADFHLAQQHPAPYRHPAYRQLFGYADNDPLSKLTNGQMDAASPVSYIAPDSPPVLTAHGTGDTTVPVEQAENLIAKLKKQGVTTANYILPGGNHGLSNPKPEWPDYRQATVEFLKKYLLQ
jgi:acetyl esterase/lipase